MAMHTARHPCARHLRLPPLLLPGRPLHRAVPETHTRAFAGEEPGHPRRRRLRCLCRLRGARLDGPEDLCSSRCAPRRATATQLGRHMVDERLVLLAAATLALLRAPAAVSKAALRRRTASGVGDASSRTRTLWRVAGRAAGGGGRGAGAQAQALGRAGRRACTCTKSRNVCTFSASSASSLVSHTLSYLGSEERKGCLATVLVCVADVRYFITSTYFLRPCFSAVVFKPSTRQTRDSNSSVAAEVELEAIACERRTVEQRSKQAKVTRCFGGGRAERCGQSGKGVRRADPPAVSARRVAHVMEPAWRAPPRRAPPPHILWAKCSSTARLTVYFGEKSATSSFGWRRPARAARKGRVTSRGQSGGSSSSDLPRRSTKRLPCPREKSWTLSSESRSAPSGCAPPTATPPSLPYGGAVAAATASAAYNALARRAPVAAAPSRSS